MVSTAQDFWKLLVASRLFSGEECARIERQLTKEAGDLPEPDRLAEWLVQKRWISPYQAQILGKGQPGPFLFGDYRVYDRIKRGRLASLFRAVHGPTKHKVCLYFLTGPALGDGAAIARMQRQLAQAAAIASPQVARCYELVDLGKYKFIAVEDLRGESLAERLARIGPLKPDVAGRAAGELAAGLSVLHAARLVHGDLRPDNAWLDKAGGTKLLWFPFSHDALTLAPWSQTPGEPPPERDDYLAPEMAAPGRLADPRADLYSLGRLIGRMSDDSSGNSSLPPDLARLVERLTADDPASRLGVADEVVAALSGYAAPNERAANAAGNGDAAASNYERRLADRRAALAAVATAHPVAQVAAAPGVPPIGVESPSTEDHPAGPMVLFPDLAGTSGPLSPSARTRGRRAASRRTVPWIITGIAAMGLLIAVVAYSMRPGAADSKQSGAVDDGEVSAPEDESNAGTGAAAEVASAEEENPQPPAAGTAAANLGEIKGIGSRMRRSPTLGKPLDLRYLPSGCQFIVAVRPSDLVPQAGGEGERLLDTLGLSAAVETELPEILGPKVNQIDQLLIAVLDGDASPPKLAFVVRTVEEIEESELVLLWHEPTLETKDGNKVYRGPNWCYYLPTPKDTRTFAVMPPDQVEGVTENGINPPLMLPDFERVVEVSDADRMVTVIVQPNLLLTGSDFLFAGEREKLREPVEVFLGIEPRVVLASVHLAEDHSFFELIVSSAADAEPQVVAKRLGERWRAVPVQGKQYLKSLDISPYAMDVLFEFPGMLEAWEEYTQFGIAGKLVVARSYLPPQAPHNLALATQLALTELPGEGGGAAAAVVARKPDSIQDKLETVVSLTFELENFETALEDLGEMIDAKIMLRGTDLETIGVTRNQQFKLDENDKPASEILKAVLMKADPADRLAYVIGKQGTEDVVFVTTKQIAKDRQEELPPGLE